MPRARAEPLHGFRNCALTNVALLKPGEAVDSPRVVRTVGPNVMASVYYFRSSSGRPSTGTAWWGRPRPWSSRSVSSGGKACRS